MLRLLSNQVFRLMPFKAFTSTFRTSLKETVYSKTEKRIKIRAIMPSIIKIIDLSIFVPPSASPISPEIPEP